MGDNVSFMAAQPVDPSWLPSTVAQSTAALVGIVGGLLVARFMSIDSDQKALASKLGETRERLTFEQQERDKLYNKWQRNRAVRALTSRKAINLLIRLRDVENLPAQAVLDSIENDELAGPEIEPWLGEARSAVQGTFGVLERELPEEETPTKWVVERRKAGLPDDDWDLLREAVYDIVSKTKLAEAAKKREIREAEEAEAERKRRLAKAGPLSAALLSTPKLSLPRISSLASGLHQPFVLPQARAPSFRIALDDRLDEAEDSLRRAQFEFDQADRAVKEHALPSELMVAVWVLTGLTAVGLVWPIIALFAMRSYGSEPLRMSVLIAFLVGISALLAYLWRTAARLARSRRNYRSDDGARGTSRG
jgi:hypothetical protein